MKKTNKKLYCIPCDYLFEKETNLGNAGVCPKCKNAASTVSENHPFYKGYKKMRYIKEEERLGKGLCPKCETKFKSGHQCPNCAWVDKD